MRHPKPFPIVFFGLLLLFALTGGCQTVHHAKVTGSSTIDTDRIIAELTPSIEALYLDWHELDQIYKDIKFLERGFLFEKEDRQLGYIQKVCLYIQDASVRIYNQWSQLSIIHYIRPEFIQDYLTLRSKGLTLSIDAIDYDEKFIAIYRSSIKQSSIQADMEKALIQIKKLKLMMSRIEKRITTTLNSEN